MTIWVARGSRPGPTLCVVAGVHGDELNGPEIGRRVFATTDPTQRSGTLIVLPGVNAHGFRTGNRYMPDRRDLNRSFPGSPDGSVASIVAAGVFEIVRAHCNALVDLRRLSVPVTHRDHLFRHRDHSFSGWVIGFRDRRSRLSERYNRRLGWEAESAPGRHHRVDRLAAHEPLDVAAELRAVLGCRRDVIGGVGVGDQLRVYRRIHRAGVRYACHGRARHGQ